MPSPILQLFDSLPLPAIKGAGALVTGRDLARAAITFHQAFAAQNDLPQYAADLLHVAADLADDCMSEDDRTAIQIASLYNRLQPQIGLTEFVAGIRALAESAP